MRVWIILPEESCTWLEFEQEWSLEDMQSFDGRSKAREWSKAEMRLLAEGGTSVKSDFYLISKMNGYAVDQKVKDVLSVRFGAAVEFLPLNHEGHEIYLMNVLDVVDCLDVEHSRLKRFSGSQRISSISSYSFYPAKVSGHGIFRLAELPRSNTFVTKEFLDVYEAADLHGLKFELVWVSDDDGESCARRESIAEISLPQDRWFPYAGPVEMSAIEEIRSNSEEVQRLLGVSLEDDAPSCVNAIEEKVQELLDGSKGVLEEKELICESIKLGSLFGEALCKAYGWWWKKVGQDEEGSAYAVCSPQDLYCVFPFQVIQLILEGGNIGPDGTNDNTAMLLFNMLESIERSVPEKTLTPLG